MSQNGLRGGPTNGDLESGRPQGRGPLPLDRLAPILKEEKRGRGEFGLSQTQLYPPLVNDNNRTSLTVYTPDIFSCA
jgi:hypothetical protein